MQNALSSQKNGQANMQRQVQICIHMDAQANTQTDRPVYTDISTHTHKYIYYTQTHHSAVLSGQCLFGRRGGVRLSEQ